ncbi:MAG: hypothetical protein AAF658_17490 [Myxococcota bacterium]
MSALLHDVDPILDQAEAAALALDSEGLTASISALAEYQSHLKSLGESDPARLHVAKRLLRLRGLCSGLKDSLGQALGIEQRYGAQGERVGSPMRPSRRGYV